MLHGNDFAENHVARIVILITAGGERHDVVAAANFHTGVKVRAGVHAVDKLLELLPRGKVERIDIRIAARDKGRYMWMTGNCLYKHQIKLSGSYSFKENLSVYGQGVYTIQIYNSNVIQGIELACGVEYKIFN